MTTKPEVRWDQFEFDKFMNGLSPERREQDNKRLQEIFNHAAEVPVFKEALDWAQQHDIKFFIDHTCVKIAGYYKDGTGVVGLSEARLLSVKDPVEEAVVTLVHEIRHAWQNYHGLLSRSNPDFADCFIKTALIEADAYAFERRAADEFRLARLKERKNLIMEEDKMGSFMNKSSYSDFSSDICNLQSSLADENSHLRKNFLDWFKPETGIAAVYGNIRSRWLGKWLGICDVNPVDFKAEFRPAEVWLLQAKNKPEINLAHSDDISRLGKTFSGKNYLDKLPKDTLNKLTKPSLARSFYNAANDDQKKLVAEIRKRQLKNNLKRPMLITGIGRYLRKIAQ